MQTIQLTSQKSNIDLLNVVQNAIHQEISRIELAIKLADARLKPFEEKYQVTSSDFIEHMTAEDLIGGDDEYIDWAGEYDLREDLKKKLDDLKGIQYGSHDHRELY